jgi:hypothetical protein
MGKKTDKRDAEDRARRKLAKAQLQMQIAQEKRRQAMTRGEHEIEQARLRAAKWLEKATRRVEQSAAAVAKAEAGVAQAETGGTAATMPSSPVAAVDVLQQEVRPAHERPDQSLNATETVEVLQATDQSSVEGDSSGNSLLP